MSTPVVGYACAEHLWLTSNTFRARDNVGLFERLKVKKRLSNAFPSSSSNTICSVASAASAAAAAASLSFLASSIKLCRLPTNLGDWTRENERHFYYIEMKFTELLLPRSEWLSVKK